MRTAEEILNKKLGPYSVKLPEHLHEAYKEALNEARIECINECAEKATLKGVSMESSGYEEVDKQSILKLIDQVK